MISPRAALWAILICAALWLVGCVVTRALRVSGYMPDYSIDRDRLK